MRSKNWLVAKTETYRDRKHIKTGNICQRFEHTEAIFHQINQFTNQDFSSLFVNALHDTGLSLYELNRLLYSERNQWHLVHQVRKPPALLIRSRRPVQPRRPVWTIAMEVFSLEQQARLCHRQLLQNLNLDEVGIELPLGGRSPAAKPRPLQGAVHKSDGTGQMCLYFVQVNQLVGSAICLKNLGLETPIDYTIESLAYFWG